MQIFTKASILLLTVFTSFAFALPHGRIELPRGNVERDALPLNPQPLPPGDRIDHV